jgi:hypothetical protein
MTNIATDQYNMDLCHSILKIHNLHRSLGKEDNKNECLLKSPPRVFNLDPK